MKRSGHAGWPIWVWGILAYLGWAIRLESHPPEVPPGALERLEELRARERRPPDPSGLSAREWRRIGGVGEKRALDLVRDRWAAGPGWSFSEVEGIGPVTEGKIRAWFLERGLEPGE